MRMRFCILELISPTKLMENRYFLKNVYYRKHHNICCSPEEDFGAITAISLKNYSPSAQLLTVKYH